MKMPMMRSFVYGMVMLGTLCAVAETDTVLLCYATNVMCFSVQDGVWSAQSDFAQKAQNYGGKSQTFAGIASDGRRVFVGEAASTSSRILEFDLGGNYVRTLTGVTNSVEYMGISHDGKWVYATVGALFTGATTNAAVYRYHAITGEGGLFIPNSATNALGVNLWRFQIPRGMAVDEDGNVWVSERSSGTVYKFSESDGALLGTFTSLWGVQGLYYSSVSKKVYCTSNSDNSYVIDTATGTVVTRAVSGIGNRLGITQVQGTICSAPWFTPATVGYDLDSTTPALTTLSAAPVNGMEMITLPRAPIREIRGKLLVSETLSNRVTRFTMDSLYVMDPEGTFAGGEDVFYAGTILRNPRGLASFSNAVYVAEGVEGGRVLRFSKWGTFKEVTVNFAATPYSSCVPTALAVSPDGGTLYVSDAHTLFLSGNNAVWANVPTNGYYSTNTFGEAVYKVNVHSRAVSIFADAANCTTGNTLLETHGLAVDSDSNVYCSAWYNKTGSVYTANGTLYKFASDGTRLVALSIGNPTVCYYDPSGTYVPAAASALVTGAGVLFTGNGMQDFWWTAASGNLGTYPKIVDLNNWRNYMDAEVVDGRMWFTDPEYGTLWCRTGEAACEATLTGLVTPSYLAFVQVTGLEPPPLGTLMSIH